MFDKLSPFTYPVVKQLLFQHILQALPPVCSITVVWVRAKHGHLGYLLW